MILLQDMYRWQKYMYVGLLWKYDFQLFSYIYIYKHIFLAYIYQLLDKWN